MESKTYFFDSYAIIEIIKGNMNYQKYKNCEVFLTKLNLFEIYFKILKEFGEYQADKFLSETYRLAIDFNEDVIKLAAKFRAFHSNKNFSMADCIGYIMAKLIGVGFLTGDEEFRGFENVEFVK